MNQLKGGVTAPKGFSAVGIHAGIKKQKKDMAMIYSEVPCVAAGTFTTNQGTNGDLNLAGSKAVTSTEYNNLPATKTSDNNLYIQYKVVTVS